jgi:TRAP-type C4-dicarboxylate transport system permease small subunit
LTAPYAEVGGALRRLAERAIDVAAIAAFSGILLCVLLQVFCRYVLNDPLTWSEELARYLFIWCAFLGWILASRHRSHLAMSFVAERLPPRVQAGLAAAIELATIAFAWVLGTRGVRLAANNWDVANVAVPFNLGVVYVIEPIAAVAITAYAAGALFDALRRLRAPSPEARR